MGGMWTVYRSGDSVASGWRAASGCYRGIPSADFDSECERKNRTVPWARDQVGIYSVAGLACDSSPLDLAQSARVSRIPAAGAALCQRGKCVRAARIQSLDENLDCGLYLGRGYLLGSAGQSRGHE